MVAGAVLAVWSIPWLAAALGFYASDLPAVGGLWRAHEPTLDEPGIASVHLGLHEGFFGVQLAVAALVLSRCLRTMAPGRLRGGLSVYLAVMLAYGVLVSLQDGWHKQVEKRGWADVGMPDVLTPHLSLGWLGLLLAAAAIHACWFRTEIRSTAPAAGAPAPFVTAR